MNGLAIVIIAFLVLALAYRVYGSFLAAKVAMPSDEHTTPAVRFEDGKNFHATNKVVVFGHYFAAIVLSGQELLAGLSALLPPPRIHTVRYYGVWAPRSGWRSFVLQGRKRRRWRSRRSQRRWQRRRQHGLRGRGHHRYRLSWAQAIAKVFEGAQYSGYWTTRFMADVSLLLKHGQELERCKANYQES